MRRLFIIVASLVLAATSPVTSGGAEAAHKVAIFPWKLNAAGDVGYIEKATYDMLSSRVGSAGDIVLIKRSAVLDAVGGFGEMTDDEARRIGKELGADYVLHGTLSILGESVSLDGRLINVTDGTETPFYSNGTGVDSLVQITESFASNAVSAITGGPGIVSGAVEGVDTDKGPAAGGGPGALGDDGSSGFLVTKGGGSMKKALWKSAELDGKGFFRSFVTVDLDGDGTKEIVLISERDVVVAVIEDGKLRVLKRFEGKAGDQYLYLGVTEGPDGAPAVYLSRVSGGSASSRILEYRSKRYVMAVEGIKWLLRVVDVDGGGPGLVGVKYSTFRGLGSGFRQLEREDGKVVDKGALKVPRNLSFYSFGYGELFGGAPTEMVALDDRYRINVYARDGKKWKRFWKGKERHGGTLNILEFSPDELAIDKGEFMPVNGRFILGDFNGDGVSEFIIKKNESKGFMGKQADRPLSFDSGIVVAYIWEREDALGSGEFTEVWRTRKVKGYISEFLIDDIDSDGESELVMLIVEGVKGMKQQGKSYLVSFGLGG